MGLDIRLVQKMELGLKLAPQIIQSIELLQLPSMDLMDMIEQELDQNEFLEKAPAEDAPAEKKEEAEPAGEEAEREAELEKYEQLDIWDDPALRRSRSRDEKFLNAKAEAMQNTADDGPDLGELLLEQYELVETDPRLRPLAEQIIFNLDDRGYLPYSLEEVVEPFADSFDRNDAEHVLELVQKLEPRGVGARSIEECLLLQLDPGTPDYEVKRELIAGHLDDVRKNRLPKVAKAMGLDIDRLKEILGDMSSLDPTPGLSSSSERNHYIQPDIIVEWSGEDYEVRLANDYVPELRLSEEYRLALQSDSVSKDYREYVKKKVDSARAFIMAIEKRQKTLLEVARRIVEHQRDFLDFGPHYLKPLKMQEIADDVGVHVSTISRATSDKWVQTHRGIFPLKHFFTGGTRSVDGQEQSRESIKNKIKELVDQEDRQSPLSDDDLVAALKKRHGVQVARRTVTKYRKALGLGSSRQRREY